MRGARKAVTVVLFSSRSYSYVARISASERLSGVREPAFVVSLPKAMKFRSAEAAWEYKMEKHVPEEFRGFLVSEGGFYPLALGAGRLGARP